MSDCYGSVTTRHQLLSIVCPLIYGDGNVGVVVRVLPLDTSFVQSTGHQFLYSVLPLLRGGGNVGVTVMMLLVDSSCTCCVASGCSDVWHQNISRASNPVCLTVLAFYRGNLYHVSITSVVNEMSMVLSWPKKFMMMTSGSLCWSCKHVFLFLQWLCAWQDNGFALYVQRSCHAITFPVNAMILPYKRYNLIILFSHFHDFVS